MEQQKKYLAHSLLEWVGETERVLTKRAQPTGQQAAAQRDNLTELGKLAKFWRSYPDSKLWA